MKLIAKYNRVTIPIIIAVLLISSIGYYLILHRILIYQLDKDLRIEKREILQHVKETGQLPETSDYKDQQIFFRPTSLTTLNDKYSTEDSYKKQEDETESFRKIDFLVTLGGQRFIATVKKSQQETEDIVRLILTVTFIIIVILLLILFVFNRFLLSNLWKPFRNTLHQISQFNFHSKNQIRLETTDIDEFKELNQTVLFMTQQVTKDYQALKSFTENASHEIQTPLAIIKNKIELLTQSENLSETQIKVLQTLDEVAARLSRLNQSLLLLAKIENRQFPDVEPIDFSYMLHRYLDNFDELAQAKGLKISTEISDKVQLQMNESLAEILIANVISNAIKHNWDNGEILVVADSTSFRVTNSGAEPQMDTSELLQRFKKESSSRDSLGLGLSIVKSIADLYGFSVNYLFKNGHHTVEVIFQGDRTG